MPDQKKQTQALVITDAVREQAKKVAMLTARVETTQEFLHREFGPIKLKDKALSREQEAQMFADMLKEKCDTCEKQIGPYLDQIGKVANKEKQLVIRHYIKPDLEAVFVADLSSPEAQANLNKIVGAYFDLILQRDEKRLAYFEQAYAVKRVIDRGHIVDGEAARALAATQGLFKLGVEAGSDPEQVQLNMNEYERRILLGKAEVTPADKARAAAAAATADSLRKSIEDRREKELMKELKNKQRDKREKADNQCGYLPPPPARAEIVLDAPHGGEHTVVPAEMAAARMQALLDAGGFASQFNARQARPAEKQLALSA